MKLPRAATSPEFLKRTGQVAAASALVVGAAPHVHAAENNTIQVALIGCGGRGTGAAANALAVTNGPIKLVAMADVFPDRPRNSCRKPEEGFPEPSRCAGGPAVCRFRRLPEGHGLPQAGRHCHICHAAGVPLGAFCLCHPEGAERLHGEATDGGWSDFPPHDPSSPPRHRRRTSRWRGPDVPSQPWPAGTWPSASRTAKSATSSSCAATGCTDPSGSLTRCRSRQGISELLFQIQRFHSFLWAGGGCFSDFNIHIIDHMCWMKNAWPVKAQAVGGRHYRQNPDGITYVDQNFDTYSVEYTFADGAKFFMDGRCMTGCNDIYSSYAQGSKGMAVVSKSGDCGMPSSIYQGPDLTSDPSCFGNPKSNPNDRIPIRTNGTTWWTPSATTSPTTRSNAASKRAS